MRLLAFALIGCSTNASEPAMPVDSGVDAVVVDDTAPRVVVWPNDESRANSDPWLREHHDEIEQLRPKILILNYVNAKTNEQSQPLIDQIFAALRESSRYRGYKDPAAKPAFDPQIVKLVDLRDATPMGPLRNSSLYPRRADPSGKLWGFDYAKLFDAKYAEHYGMGGDLCTLVDEGKVNEVWIVGDGDYPDVSAAEVLEWKPKYSLAGEQVGTLGDRCAGNGCFDVDVPHCARSLRIGWVNHTRGPGCYLESLAHGMESMSTRGVIPYLKAYFPQFAGFDLDARYMLPFKSWVRVRSRQLRHVRQPDLDLVRHPRSVRQDRRLRARLRQRALSPERAPPLRRRQRLHRAIDVRGLPHRRDETAVLPRQLQAVQGARARLHRPVARVVRQNWPSHGSSLKDNDGKPMKSWWPYLYY